MAAEFLFEDWNGVPIPRLPGTADGKTMLSTTQAAERFGRSADWLAALHGAFFEGVPAACDNASLPWLRDEAALRVLWQAKFAHLAEEDFHLVVAECHRRGFSPWARMIYAERRYDPEGETSELVTYATIEAIRAIAHRSGDYVGVKKTEFVYGPDDLPISACVRVQRFVRGKKRTFETEVLWRDHFPGKGVSEHWDTRGHLMLSKCCEAAALRRAFPELIEGLYAKEEISPPRRRQAEPREDPGVPPVRPDDDTIDPDRPRTPMDFQLRLIDYGFGSPERRNHLTAMFEKQFAKLHQTNPQGFFSAVLKVLRANPSLYGASLPMSG